MLFFRFFRYFLRKEIRKFFLNFVVFVLVCREIVFVYLIMVVGVLYVIVRVCSDGKVIVCGCDSRYKGVINEGW